MIARTLYYTLVLAVGLLCATTATNAATVIPSGATTGAGLTNRTNVLILLADDLGWGDVGYNGGRARTPNLDAMAVSSHAMVLNAMIGQPLCSPSRAILLSGQYPDRNCVSGVFIHETYKPTYNMRTVAMDARAVGYRTAFFGKWHLGPVEKNMIESRGFDTWTGAEGNVATYDARCFCDEFFCQNLSGQKCLSSSSKCYKLDSETCTAFETKNCSLGHFTRKRYLQTLDEKNRQCDMMTFTGNGNLTLAQIPRHLVAAEFLVDRFKSFISTVSPSQPFLALVSFSEVHIPYIGDPEGKRNASLYHGHAFNSKINNYVTCIENIDRAIGKFQALLQRYGRSENTLIWFLSDNGPVDPKREGVDGSTGGLRGYKASLFEGGVRTPALIYWPAKIKSKSAIQTVTSLVDIRPTVRDILREEGDQSAGRTIPEEALLDGESLLPMIASPATWQRTRDLVICAPRRPGTPRGNICMQFAVYQGAYKAITRRGQQPGGKEPNFLFNLASDRAESTNLVKSENAIYRRMVLAGRPVVASILQSFRENRCMRTQE